MDKFAAVITMDQESPRFKAFTENNSHLDFAIFNAVAGEDIGVTDRVSAGVVTPELAATADMTDVGVGCAVSHWSLWQEAISRESGILILEDDVVTHPQIWAQVESLPDLDHTDIVFFAANLNAPMAMFSPEGYKQSSLFDPRNPHPDWIKKALAATDVETVRYWKLSRASGTCCYFVTPEGARKLVKNVLPLRTDGVIVPFISHLVMQSTIDQRMNALYDDITAFISIPFLAYTPHENEFALK